MVEARNIAMIGAGMSGLCCAHRLSDAGYSVWAELIAGEVLAEAGFQTGKSELFPIPTAEITLSNGQLTQNFGY